MVAEDFGATDDSDNLGVPLLCFASNVFRCFKHQHFDERTSALDFCQRLAVSVEDDFRAPDLVGLSDRDGVGSLGLRVPSDHQHTARDVLDLIRPKSTL